MSSSDTIDRPENVSDSLNQLPGMHGLNKVEKAPLVSVEGQEADKMRIKINHTQPVELFDLTNCLLAVAREYNRFSKKKLSPDYDETQKDLRLFIHEIRPGSIEIDLILQNAGNVAAGLFSIPAANSVIEFCKHIVDIKTRLRDWFSNDGKAASTAPPIQTKAELEDVQSISEVVANNGDGSSMDFGIVKNNGVYIKTAIFIHDDEKKISRNTKKLLQTQTQPDTSTRTNVLLYWEQVKNKEGKTETDKAIIEAISPKPVKVRVDSEIREKMIYGEENFFKYGYLVDVTILTARNKIVMYVVNALHEVVPLDEDD